MAQLDYGTKTSLATNGSQGHVLNPARGVSYETKKEDKMSAMIETLRRLHGLPRNVSGKAPARVVHHTRTEQPTQVAKVRQWNDLIPISEVSRIRYVAESGDGSAPLARVVLP
jgi:hypothetical protein